MTCYSVQARDSRSISSLCFTRDMGENIGKNRSKNLRSKYSQKFFDHVKQSPTDASKTDLKKKSNSKNCKRNW